MFFTPSPPVQLYESDTYMNPSMITTISKWSFSFWTILLIVTFNLSEPFNRLVCDELLCSSFLLNLYLFPLHAVVKEYSMCPKSVTCSVEEMMELCLLYSFIYVSNSPAVVNYVVEWLQFMNFLKDWCCLIYSLVC